MKKVVVNFTVIIILFFTSCNSDYFIISGNIIGSDSNKLLYTEVVNNKPVFLDTIQINNGAFTYKAKKLHQDDFRFLVPLENKRVFIKFFADNSDLQIQADLQNIDDAKVEGSKQNDLFNTLMADYELIEKESKVFSLQMQVAIMDSDTIAAEEFENKMYRNETRKSQLFLDFADSNHNSVLAAWALFQIIDYKEYGLLSKVYDKLSDKAKSSSYGSNLKLVLDEMAKTAIGAQAPDFKLHNLEGKMVELRAFKGKKLLIEFWSPDCDHCRYANAILSKLYKTYSTKNFEFVAINVDLSVDKEYWKRVVAEDGLDFPQLIDSVGVADDYKINSTPYFYLLDEEGKILLKNFEASELEELLSKY